MVISIYCRNDCRISTDYSDGPTYVTLNNASLTSPRFDIDQSDSTESDGKVIALNMFGPSTSAVITTPLPQRPQPVAQSTPLNSVTTSCSVSGRQKTSLVNESTNPASGRQMQEEKLDNMAKITHLGQASRVYMYNNYHAIFSVG